MGCGGCGSQQTTSYSYQNGIQSELLPYATKILGKADALTDVPMLQYTGPTVAGITPLQAKAMEGYKNLGPSSYLGQGAQYAQQGANLAGYAATRDFTGDNVNKYMSPYIENVVNAQTQGAVRDYSRSIPGMSANAAKAGGLGGTRSALVQSEGQRNLQNQLGDIRAKGYQSGYESARNQFNTSNQNMMAGAGQLMTGAGQFGQLGNLEFNQNLNALQGMSTAGALQQQMEQNRLNAEYQKFVNKQMEPYQRYQYMMGMIRGTPIQNLGQTMYAPAPSFGQQLMGTGMGLYGLSQAYGQSKPAREGGSTEDIKGYAGGGIVSLARGGSTSVEKMGAIDASTKQLSKSMPPQAANARVQQTVSSLPDSVDWQEAAALLAYNKAHPATVEPPKQDSVVVQMAKQIAMQADAEKMAEAQKAQQAQQEQMAMQQMQQMQQAQQAQQQGIAGLPTPDVGQNFTPNGITAPPQEAPQDEQQVNAAEGGGIADLQSNVGEHYASGGIVAFDDGGDVVHARDGLPDTSFSDSDEEPSWLDRSNAYFLASQAQNQARAEGQPLPQSVYSVPRPAILGTSLNMAGAPGSGGTRPTSSPSILQSKTLTPVEGSTFNRAPYAQSSILDASGALSSGLTPALANSAFNRMLESPTKPTTSQAPAAQAATRYDDSRYAPAIAAATTKTSTTGVARPKTQAEVNIPEIEDHRMTAEDYFKEQLKYKEKAGLNKATSDLSKFLDNEELNAARDAKLQRSLALAQFGFDIASTPGGIMQGIAAGGKGYASSLAAINKEQHAVERSMAKSRLELAHSVAEEDFGAWKEGLKNFREDSDKLEGLKMQRNQLREQQRHDIATEANQAYATSVTADYYKHLTDAAGLKTNAVASKYQNLFTAAMDKYAQTGDPRDKAAADHYQNILSQLADPTGTKVAGAETKLSAAQANTLKSDVGVQMATIQLMTAQQNGDPAEIATAQQQLAQAQQAALAPYNNFSNQLASAPGTGLNSLGGSTSGWKIVGTTPTGPGMR